MYGLAGAKSNGRQCRRRCGGGRWYNKIMTKPVQPTAEETAVRVVRKLQESGYEAYFAGGCVRDKLMGLTPQDYDVATSAKPAEVGKLFPHSQKVGAVFGVVIVRRAGQVIEVATFRCDGPYADGRHPSQVTFATARQDAQRRDFTCNGLFFDPIAGRLIDYVGGQEDIGRKFLRAIGPPLERFREDHLRMIRAMRFAARLGFSIDPATWDAIDELAAHIATVSRERIGQELRMLLTHPSRWTGVDLLAQSGLLDHFWPFPVKDRQVPARRDSWLGRLPAPSGFATALAAMVHDVSGLEMDPAYCGRRLQEALALSGQEVQDIGWFLAQLPLLGQWRNQRKARLKRLLADVRCDDLVALYTAAETDAVESTGLPARLAELRREPIAPAPLVTGDDLISLGVRPGPRFKHWLEELYDRQLENQFADRAGALAAARRLVFPGGGG